ncbi:hypothetical protein IQ268_29640 [Oculatella sp. LEGE 06141]|uniref:hypothetical protein n=1 Tax=Oculatella sp. LEGE 06141 TaxID=1828648 RepID=UPI00187E74DB|nr:hypothetical protein [Oculatella sp. LEGE 06141]MBE9182703.1 hypothetical protein [Oculatella sp. LEGE 06141]
MINFNTLLAGTPLPALSTLSSPATGQSDPLIDQGSQLTVYVGSALIIVGIAAVVGFFSRRIEHALITAFVLSVCLLIFFALTR